MEIHLLLNPIASSGDFEAATRVGLLLVSLAVALAWVAWRLVWPNRDQQYIVDWSFNAAVAVVLAGAATLRLRAFLARRSLWLDEVSLATGVRDLSFLQLLTESLPYGQSAPLGFLLATRLGISTVGTGLLAIRLVPLASGLLVLVVALMVSRVAFRRRTSQLLFLILIGVSPALVYYSTEFKQYSSDALLVLTALFVALVGRRPEVSWLVPTLGFVAATTSLPGMLAFGSLGLAILLHAALTAGIGGLVRAFRCWINAFLVWSLGAALHLAHTLLVGTDRDAMVRWWVERGGFPPDEVSAYERLYWYFERPVQLVWMLLFPHGPIDSAVERSPTVVIIAAALLLGFALRRASFGVTLPAVFLGLLASGALLLAEFNLYPLSSRVMVYLLPVLAFALVSGYDSGMDWGKVTQPLSALAIAIILLTAGASSDAPFFKPVMHRDMEAIVQLLMREWREGDVVVLDADSWRILEWHDPEGNVSRDLVFVADYESVMHFGSLSFGASQPERIWVIATHRRAEALEMAQLIGDGFVEPAIFNRQATLVVLISRNDVAFVSTGSRRLVEVVEE